MISEDFRRKYNIEAFYANVMRQVLMDNGLWEEYKERSSKKLKELKEKHEKISKHPEDRIS